MKFTFVNYIIFCNDFDLKPSHYKSLKIFKRYCDGDLDVVFSIV